MPIASNRPMRRALACCATGNLPTKIEMNTMLSMPSTISSPVRVSSAIRFSVVNSSAMVRAILPYQPSMYAKISGATIVASLSITKRGVFTSSLPQVIFSLGTAPE